MAKNIALSDDAYSMLERLKREGESFSDVVKRLNNSNSENRPNWRDSIGAITEGDAKIFEKIIERRGKRKRRELKW